MTKHKKTPSKKDLKDTKKRSLPIKGISIFLYYLLMPIVLIFFTVRFFSFTNLTWLAVIYNITLVSIFLFFVHKFHHQKIYILAFLLGLVSSPLYAYISDARWLALARSLSVEGFLDFTYPNTTLTVFFYTIPLTFFSIIVLIIVLVLRARKKMLASSH